MSAAYHARWSARRHTSVTRVERALGQLDLRVLRLELARRVDDALLRVEPVLRERVEEPLLFAAEPPLFAAELLLFAAELLRRVGRLPAAVLAAFCAAFAACSKSLRSALPNLFESLRASERNLPRPL